MSMKILICMQDFRGGGAEKVAVLLANQLAEIGNSVAVIALSEKGSFRRNLSSKIEFHIQTSKAVKIAYKLTKYIYPKVAKVLCVSSGVAESVNSFAKIGLEKTKVLYNPVLSAEQVDNGTAWFKARPQNLNSIPTVVCVGSLSKQKNFSFLLDIYSSLKESMDFKGIIYGEGSLREELETKRIKLGLDNVEFAGFTENPLREIMHADLFFLPSLWEGLPTVLIEALSTGTKIMSNDCPSGPDEILQHGRFGNLCEMGLEASEYANILKRLLLETDKSKQQLALSRAKDFTIEETTHRYMETFEHESWINNKPQ